MLVVVEITVHPQNVRVSVVWPAPCVTTCVCVGKEDKPEMRLDFDLAPHLVFQPVLLQLLLVQHLQCNNKTTVSHLDT